LLYIFPDRADFEADALAWKLRHDNGVRWIELDEDALRQREPALHERYGFGVFIEHGAHCIDPGGYVAALAAHAQAQGARLVPARATGFSLDAGRLRAVQTDTGEIACDRAVIAAGAWSATLARQLGDAVALESERGYHVVIRDPGFDLNHPFMPSDGRMANTMTPAGLRIAGQVEIAGLEAKRNVRRARLLFNYALITYPGLPSPVPRENIAVWMGHRPSTPDSLPCIGPASGCADVVHCFGHGHIGLAAGALSGRLAADLVGSRRPVIDPAPYDPARFTGVLLWQ
jgi:D-amino-acid dehydrogenase